MDILYQTFNLQIFPFIKIFISIIIPLLIAKWLKDVLSKKYTEENLKSAKEFTKLSTNFSEFKEYVKTNRLNIERLNKIYIDHEDRLNKLEIFSFDIPLKKTDINILIVDDNHEHSMYIENYIKNKLKYKNKFKNFSFDTDIVCSYDQAIIKLKRSTNSFKKYDLSFVDIRLDSNHLGYEIGTFCLNNNLLLNLEEKPNIIYYTSDKNESEIPINNAENFITFDSDIINKPFNNFEWIIFENRLINAIDLIL